MTHSPSLIPGDAGSPCTEESEAQKQCLLSPSSPAQFLEVNKYLSDDFLCDMEHLPEFGLGDTLPPPLSLQGSGKWSAEQFQDTQQTSSTASWQDDSETPRLLSPLNLEFPDFSDILGLELQGAERARPSVSCILPKEDAALQSSAHLPKRNTCDSIMSLDSAGDSAATHNHVQEQSPYAAARGGFDCSTPTAPYSPLAVHPMTPVKVLQWPEIICAPVVAERPVVDARPVLEAAHSHPDFATIYAFLGSLFDPACAHIDHTDVLAQMAPVDRETACLLMTNLAANIGDPVALSEHLEAAAAVESPVPPLRGTAPQLRGAVPPVYPGGPPPAHVPGSSWHVRATSGSM